MTSAPGPPLIGLTGDVEKIKSGAWDEPTALLPMSYVSAVIRAGGFPVLLPPSPTPAEVAVAPLAALVITGGPDVDPAFYGAERHAKTGRPRPERDQWEAALGRAALDSGVPLLAICRGMQMLNVTLGGTLHQHLPDVVGHDTHRVAVGQMHGNAVSISPGTAVAAILGIEAVGLCHHHQAVDRLGRGVTAVGWATDGTVEAIEVEGQAFALGVQWHPEDNPDDDRLFEALVKEAAQRADTDPDGDRVDGRGH